MQLCEARSDSSLLVELHSVTLAPALLSPPVTTDYTAAITGLIVVGVLLTAMVGYVLTRPTDLGRAR